MTISVQQAYQWVREYYFDKCSARQLIQDSAYARQHSHEHIRDWSADGEHIVGTPRDRGGISQQKDGTFTMPSSTTWNLEHALVALVFTLNSDAGEMALKRLSAANIARITIQSRSGSWASSHFAEDRYVYFYSDTPKYSPQTSEGVTLVLRKNEQGNLIIVTFFPRESFDCKEMPSNDKDLVICEGYRGEFPATDYSMNSYVRRASKWFRGSFEWIKSRAGL